MLSRVFRPAARRFAQSRALYRPMAGITVQRAGLSEWKDRGKMAEELWFTQHEAEIMEKMLKKMQKQHKNVYGEAGKTQAREALIKIFDKHGAELTLEFADDLRAWRIEFLSDDNH
ncbi:hypothetical protein AAMO2058_001118500 [Amorphochlora amoebiformis]|mmetsp:Transcript_13281/g.21033  ORF Transcript_13281/g.21033 Transcript_13281/m.21033 type:complete len:116 (-) Transcript_13281:113-460(-)